MPIRELTHEQAKAHVEAPVDTDRRRRQEELRAEGDRLYEAHVKPLEQEHWGTFVAVSPAGRILLGDSLHDVTVRATEEFGLGNFLFKVGEVDVGRIR